MNNIVRMLLKRGLVTDLARISHSLDLSSPSMANTVNSALKVHFSAFFIRTEVSLQKITVLADYLS